MDIESWFRWSYRARGIACYLASIVSAGMIGAEILTNDYLILTAILIWYSSFLIPIDETPLDGNSRSKEVRRAMAASRDVCIYNIAACVAVFGLSKAITNIW